MYTCGRLRDARYRFSSTSSAITITDSRFIALNLAASCFVLGLSTVRESTTARRPSRASWEKMDAMPARYIFLLIFWVKFSSGRFGKIRPPPRHSGEDVIPARARPVPFCLNGFLVEWLTCSRSFWARVPWRALAWKATTIWWTRSSLYSRPNTVSGASYLDAAWPCSFRSSSCIVLRSCYLEAAFGCAAEDLA